MNQLYPIIRRVRRPLVPLDVPAPVAIEPPPSVPLVSLAVVDSTVVPETVPPKKGRGRDKPSR